ncbi:EscI/YscI/HrpB family type III secretion system inner rod protein [Actimicrobium sp. CCI2.3]|uniref:EscI/YscI/HrpB family type III secretion system inner rod protein n=1 Tax=Actimicrobium sp. CCI2.3 TaxID=3048616 RepID=UPI002AB42E50|nr:EscI/YscI/HrpB family type III secretion system inner rod protein [Actimicrobium sp. CCI2.3]MDY7574028.1 EscI/YscI/HrpB family type III secretion system inner rod protein [Actimicrobium sp. CCI2.3]MEB0021864.1 EscI/YscI/HrpB family type III secretion system inner rod protein [Actimicrobium sp. CCI2.3]
MSPVSPVTTASTPEGGLSSLQIDITAPTDADNQAFAQAMQQHTAAPGLRPGDTDSQPMSMSSQLVNRATELASEVQKDQQYVSQMLERASQTGDQSLMLKAMLALNDYQTRVQFISKTITKASTSVDQLTRMQ